MKRITLSSLAGLSLLTVLATQGFARFDKIVNATDAGKALDEFSPPHEAYQKLKVKLAEMRAKSAGARSEVASRGVIRRARRGFSQLSKSSTNS